MKVTYIDTARLWYLAKKIFLNLDLETLLNQTIILSKNLLAVPVPDIIASEAEKDCKAQALVDIAIPFARQAAVSRLTRPEEVFSLDEQVRLVQQDLARLLPAKRFNP